MKSQLRIQLIDQMRETLEQGEIDEDAMLEAYMRKHTISLRDARECLKMAKPKPIQEKL